MGLTLPTYGIGAAGLGNLYQAISDEDARATLDHIRAAGFDYLDTAPHYGHGLSEQRLGDYFKQSGWRPHITTKVGRVLKPVQGDMPDFGFVNPAPFVPTFDYSGEGIEASFKSSQGRLGVESVDALLLHDIGRLTHGDDHPRVLAQALAEAFPAMEGLKASGKTQAIGMGVNEVAICEEVLSHRKLDVILLAGRYTLLEHADTLGFLDNCHKESVRLIIGGAFNSGLLAGANKYDYGDAPDWAINKTKALNAVCAKHSVSLPAAALQFCAAHPAVISVIPGVQQPSHVTDAKKWVDEKIPAALWDELKENSLIDGEAPIPS